MRLTDANLHPIDLWVENEKIVAYKLSLGDLEGIAEGICQQQRESAPDLEARNKIEPMTPGQLLGYLLTTARGQALTLYTAIAKSDPSFPISRIYGLTWNDDLVQTVYDLLEVKRATRPGPTREGEHCSDPQPSGCAGEPCSPSLPTTSPDLTGGGSPTERPSDTSTESPT